MDLTGARAKLDRAKKFRDETKQHLADYYARGPLSTYSEFLPDNKVRFYIRVHENVPNDIALSTGDCIHNLRAVLDHIAIQLVLINRGNKDGKNFPFPKKKENFASTAATNLAGVPAKAIQMVNSLEPWPGGKYKLYELHKLDIVDKHKSLFVAACAGKEIELVAMPFGVGMGQALMENAWFPIKDGDFVHEHTVAFQAPGAYLEPRIHYDIKIAEEFGSESYPLEILEEFTTNVEFVLSEFEKEFAN